MQEKPHNFTKQKKSSFIYISLFICGSGTARDQDVSCWFLTSEAQIQPQDSPWKIWGMLDEVALAKAFLQVVQFFLTYKPSTNDPYSFIMRNW